MYIAQPMRYDESVTYMYFVRLPWSEAVSTYTYPNNHVLHTLLVKAFATVFGASPWALRMPAFIAGSLVIPATYLMARELYGSKAALIATALVATSGTLVLYSANARGYSLVVLAFVVLVLIAIRLIDGAAARRKHWVLFAFISALALWTIPVALYPLGAVALWFAATRLVQRSPRDLVPLAVAIAGAGAMSLLLYSPIIGSHGIGALADNRFVASSGWRRFLAELPVTLGEAARSWTLGVPRAVSLILAGCLVVALLRHRTLPRHSASLPIAAIVWSASLLAIMHRAPFPRVWLWMAPLAACLAGAGAVHLGERWLRTRRLVEARAGIVAIVLALGLASSVVTSFAVLLSRDTGTFRDADEAASVLASLLQPGDAVIAGVPTNGPLDYYLHRRGLGRGHLEIPAAAARRAFIVVDAGEGQTLQRLTLHSEVGDSAQFGSPAVAATLPASRIYLFERRDSAKSRSGQATR
jgi:4-amino-4-deoxy-L-arabinose transferase-like glycosyltransferase